MKKLVKDETHYLQDMLAGMQVSAKSIEVISDSVVVKKDKKQQGPTLVSGGGSGHEPAHAGFVAQGMLDAAVCGEIFTSPTPDKILNAIKAVDNGDGVLLIVKNYAGDVMNFEMAQDMAQMEDINVAMVVVKDDIAVDNETQRRGVAGTVLVHKYAGYLAEQGENLETIQQKVQQFIDNIKTIGMALTAPLVPSTGKYGFDIAEDEIEIGIGIHGERGISKEKIMPVDEIVDKLIAELVKEINDKELIVMVNGMGGTPLSELDIVTKYVDDNLSSRGLNVKHWIVGEYMTSLDMQGVSITIAPHTDELETALTAYTDSRYFD